MFGKRKRHKFPASTVGLTAHLPGVGLTITRANVRLYQAARVGAGLPPASAREVAEEFTKPLSPRQGWEPSARHLARAMRAVR